MRRLGLTALLFILLPLSGCFALPVEEPIPPPPMARPLPDVPFVRTWTVVRGDVIHYENVRADFVAAREEGQYFEAQWGVNVTGIYVMAGDHVQEGDLLASSQDFLGAQEALDEAAERDEYLQFRFAQVERQRQLAIAQAEAREEPLDDSAYLAEAADWQRQINLNREEIDFWYERNEARLVRASMDGIIMSRAPFTGTEHEPMMFNAWERSIATIADLDVILFRLHGTDLRLGDEKILTIANEPYIAEVVEEDEDTVYLQVLDGQGDLPFRPIATARFLLGEVTDVIYVPLNILHRVENRDFVFILSERGIRKLREVRLGLVGNEAAEIISGLREGELIIID